MREARFVLQAANDFVFATVDHRHANLADDGHGSVGLAGLEKRFDDFLRGAKVLVVGCQNTRSASAVALSQFDS